jgi:hypothetical protein
MAVLVALSALVPGVFMPVTVMLVIVIAVVISRPRDHARR